MRDLETEAEWQPASTTPPWVGWYIASIVPMRSPVIVRYWDGAWWSAPVRADVLGKPGTAEAVRATCSSSAALDHVGRIEWQHGAAPDDAPAGYRRHVPPRPVVGAGWLRPRIRRPRPLRST